VITSRKRIGRPSLGGLLSSRTGALALAALCGLLALAIIAFALSKYRHSVTTSAPKQATVLVATSEIPKGRSADVIAEQKLYKLEPMTESQVSSGAITNAGAIVGKIASNTILPGQQLTAADFTTPSGVAETLAPGERAVAVTLDPAHAVANVLQTGDHVDVYGSVPSKQIVGLLVPDAIVLKAPSASAASTGQGGTVLLAVSDLLSPTVMWVYDNGKLWLELRGPDASKPAAATVGPRQILTGAPSSTAPSQSSSTTTTSKP
jgi:pilus assembly protein CpaB